MTPTLALASSAARRCASAPPMMVNFSVVPDFISTSNFKLTSAAMMSALLTATTSGICPYKRWADFSLYPLTEYTSHLVTFDTFWKDSPSLPFVDCVRSRLKAAISVLTPGTSPWARETWRAAVSCTIAPDSNL